ncbi:MAG: ATP-grasp domain-containing protein [Candidatus Doudnabacteria bacterium]
MNDLTHSWRKYVRNLDDVIEQLHLQQIIAVGVAPYQRIIPAFFMRRSHYQIYCVRDSADIDVLQNYANIYCLEQKNPKIALKVQSTGYLLKNYMFQGFLKNQRSQYTLLFYQTTKPIVDFLNAENIPWIGNDPKSFDPVLHKDTFRNLLKSLKLKHLEDWTLSVAEFRDKNFEEIFKRWGSSVVVQPGDYEISGGTMFIHSEQDLLLAKQTVISEKFEKVHTIKLTPFVTGNALSMLGCATEQGVLTSTLQLQLVDVPESLHGHPASGHFFGHDWGFHPWSSETEKKAQKIVETIGHWLYRRGYTGIFGIDFILDQEKNDLYPLECNPRFTGAIPVYSQLNLLTGVPPIDFFTLVSYLKIPVQFDFNAVNDAWKQPHNVAHIAIVPYGIETMKVNLACGIYTYHEKEKALEYLRPGAFLHELKNDREFIIIDPVPRLNQPIMQGVPRLFKFIFPHTIAEATNKIKPLYGEILSSMGNLLRH